MWYVIILCLCGVLTRLVQYIAIRINFKLTLILKIMIITIITITYS